MALDHVHQRAGSVVVASSVLEGELFVEHNVDALNVFVAPQRLEQPVGKAHADEIEHSGASKEMINAMYLLFGHQFGKELIEARRAFLVGAERLFQYQGRALWQ